MRGFETLGCLPCPLHWFLPREGCRGHLEEAATLTPVVVAVVFVVEAWRRVGVGLTRNTVSSYAPI